MQMFEIVYETEWRTRQAIVMAETHDDAQDKFDAYMFACEVPAYILIDIQPIPGHVYAGI